MRQLGEYDWPGNVRELANILERAVISSRGPVLSLPTDFGRSTPTLSPPPAQRLGTLEEVERSHVLRVLEHSKWKINGPGGAAEILAMHPNTLRSRMSRLGIAKPAQGIDTA
jgi:transcriptional regulator with GAF, ATPase, and Fis domain